MTPHPLLLLALSLYLLSACKSQQVDQTLLGAMKTDITTEVYPNIDAVIVEQGDSLIIEAYFNGFGPDSLHDTRSAFKSITSLLTGIAIDQGLMSLEDTLGRFFPELTDPRKKIIRVKDLLEMRSGLNCEEFYDIGPNCEDGMWESDDWIAYCLSIEVKRPPGVQWSYSSNDPVILGEVISRASGMTIMAFAQQNLFDPLGMEQYQWTITPKGRGMTAGSFYIRPLDMLKVIRLVYQKGNWEGQQIVSESWIERSTHDEIVLDFSFLKYSGMKDVAYENTRYGFYWYRERLPYADGQLEVLFASGNGGQYMMLLPAYDTKIVFTGSNYGSWRGKMPFAILLKYIMPMIETRHEKD